jgi:hypothetical protein
MRSESNDLGLLFNALFAFHVDISYIACKYSYSALLDKDAV